MSDDNKTFAFTTEYALMDELTGTTWKCKGQENAKVMMRSTSIMLPPMKRRVIATRMVTKWEPVEGSEKFRRSP